jgi:hypothetical protein
MVADEHQEGWYTDPFGRHDARWMSAGVPTTLVRDGNEESYDDPPHEEPTVTPTMIAAEPASNGSDLLRSGDPDGAVPLHERLNDAGQEVWGAQVRLTGPSDDQ